MDKSGRRTLGSWVVVLMGGLALGPGAASAADHRDSPLVKANGLLDINDVYIFQSPTNANNTVIITTVGPLAGVFNLPIFSPVGLYEIKVDNNGDAIENLTFRFAFSEPNRLGQQRVVVQLTRNNVTQTIAQDLTGKVILAAQGVTIAASLFDDPFFFDLNAFNRFKVSHNPGEFCGALTSDFFRGLNTMALVLEVPSSLLRADSGHPMIGVWARTLDAAGKQIDRMGRPAINTALIPDAMKDAFNLGSPSTDRTNFRSVVVATLLAYGNSAATSATFADVLLPDILTFDTSSSAGFLNGRRLPDDVIDAEFGLILAHFPNGPVTSDCIGNDSIFLNHFPYLGTPNPVGHLP